MTCYIFGAADCAVKQIVKEADDSVIAADGGLLHTARLGLVPDVVIGDFDSLGHVPEGSDVITLPVEKDMTDMQAAVEVARARGCHRFVLFGATGGRPDHTMANYQLLAALAEGGDEGYLVGDDFSVTAISDGSSLTFDSSFRGTFSVFSVGGTARGVTIRGGHYALEDGVLTSVNPMGVSNSFLGEETSVSVEKGTLLVMWEGGRLPKVCR